MRRSTTASKRHVAVLSAMSGLVLTSGLLAGCSGGNSDDAGLTGELSKVQVSGDLGQTPEVTFETPLSFETAEAQVETEGDGAELTADDYAMLDYAIFSGDDGTAIGSTWDDGAPDVIPLKGLDDTFDPLIDVLVGAKTGTRVVFAMPGTEATETTPADPSSVWVIEVDAVVNPKASGEAVDPVEGLPTVTLDDAGVPSIEMPSDFTEPTDLVAQPLIVGDGPAVESGQTVIVQYSGWLVDGTQFDSSWSAGYPFSTTIGEGSVIAGWDQGLVGQTVGSQILLVVPGDLAYGESGSGDTIPPNATLVFVIDILAAVD
jgi:peptidylprolyl isomerase